MPRISSATICLNTIKAHVMKSLRQVAVSLAVFEKTRYRHPHCYCETTGVSPSAKRVRCYTVKLQSKFMDLSTVRKHE